MKSKTFKKKLNLNKTTVENLSSAGQSAAKGGIQLVTLTTPCVCVKITETCKTCDQTCVCTPDCLSGTCPTECGDTCNWWICHGVYI